MTDIIDLIGDESGRWGLQSQDSLEDVFKRIMAELNQKYHAPSNIPETYESESDAVDRHFYEAMTDYYSSH